MLRVEATIQNVVNYVESVSDPVHAVAVNLIVAGYIGSQILIQSGLQWIVNLRHYPKNEKVEHRI